MNPKEKVINKSLIRRIWDKLMTREMISYVVFGVLTTLINLGAFYVLCKVLSMHELVGNIFAWIIAVIFAYVTNNLFVFGNGIESRQKETEKIMKFFTARLATLGIEEAGLFLFVTWLAFPKMIVKIGLAVIVIIANYVLSKLFIFKKDKRK